MDDVRSRPWTMNGSYISSLVSVVSTHPCMFSSDMYICTSTGFEFNSADNEPDIYGTKSA